MKFIEKKCPAITYVIELEEKELDTICSAMTSSVFNCEQTYKEGKMSHNDAMLARIKFEQNLESNLRRVLDI